MSRTVLVPPERFPRWCENFATRHGDWSFTTGAGLQLTAADGTGASVVLPLGLVLPPDVQADPIPAVVTAAGDEVRWCVLLVRKGGFAVATGTTDRLSHSKVGQRHVQGRTKAGGQSQQRFARRRDNQARQAYEAAAEHTHRIVTEFGPVDALVCGGDRSAVDAVLGEPRLARLASARCEPWLDVPDPRRGVLDQAVRDARSLRITIVEPPG